MAEDKGFRTPGGTGSYYFPDNYIGLVVSDYKSDNLSTSTAITYDVYNYSDTGTLNIVKSSDDGYIANLWFKVSAYINWADEDEAPDYESTCLGYDSSGNEISEFYLQTDSSGKASSDSFVFYDTNGNQMAGLPVYVYGMTDWEITYIITELGLKDSDGTYYLPDRYVQNDDVSFNLLDNRSFTYSCHNSVKTGKLQIQKTSEDNEVDNIWFKVESSLGYTANFVTDSTGFTTEIEDLPIYVPATDNNELVTYKVTELGYLQSDGIYEIPFRYKTPKSVTVKLNTDGTVTFAHITNTLKTGSLKLTKKDSSGNAISGSGWELYKSDGTAVSCTQAGNGLYIYKGTADTATTCLAPTGTLSISNLPTGDYYLEEKVVPSGYMPYGKKLSVTISADNETTLYVEIPVTENKSVLSETGGTGTKQYYFISCSFFVAAIVTIIIYFKKRKMKGENVL